jgi:hypothetical protein
MFISMLLTYSYCLGARRRRWMPFRHPFSTAGERIMENTSSCRIKLISLFLIDLYKTLPKRSRPTPLE